MPVSQQSRDPPDHAPFVFYHVLASTCLVICETMINSSTEQSTHETNDTEKDTERERERQHETEWSQTNPMQTKVSFDFSRVGSVVH